MSIIVDAAKLPAGILATRRLDDGRLLAIVPLTFGRARLGIGNDVGFDDVW